MSLRCTVLESDPSWGGKIVAHRVGDIVTEAGPDSFLSQKQAGLDLCTKLGLTDQLINTNDTGKKASVLSKGRLHDLPEGLLSFAPKQLGPFFQSGLLFPMLMAMVATFCHGLAQTLLAPLLGGHMNFVALVQLSTLGALLNSLMVPPLYVLVQLLNRWIERNENYARA